MVFVRWNKYSEEEIQVFVSHLFKSSGYTVRPQHLVDRSREKGADLIASKTGEVEKIAIQVKKKPSSSDITQLRQLARRPEEIKKYVFVEDPSTEFLNEMNAHSKKIDFWNGEKLIKEILSADPYLALLLLISDTQSARYLSHIQMILMGYYDRTKGKSLDDIKLPNPTKELFQLLWQAKDRACSLGKGLLFVGNIFDQTDRDSSALETIDLDYTAGSFARLIQDMYIQEVRALYDFFIEMSDRYGEYIEYACIERRPGTEWMYVMTFWFLLPGSVKRTFRLWEKEEEKMKRSLDELARMLPPNSSKHLKRDYSIFGAIHVLSKEVAQLGMGIEGIIDDMWRYALEGKELHP